MPVYREYPNQQLALLLRQGDRQAFAEIYQRFKGPLYAHAYRKVWDEAEADDLVHDLFAALWDRRESLELTGQLSSYLYTAIRNRVFKLIAKKGVSSAYVTSIKAAIERGDCVTDHLVRTNMLSELIEREIAALPPKMREVFLLSRKAGLSHREIAGQLEISEETVKKHVHHALRVLRVKLGLLVYLYMLWGGGR